MNSSPRDVTDGRRAPIQVRRARVRGARVCQSVSGGGPRLGAQWVGTTSDGGRAEGTRIRRRIGRSVRRRRDRRSHRRASREDRLAVVSSLEAVSSTAVSVAAGATDASAPEPKQVSNAAATNSALRKRWPVPRRGRPRAAPAVAGDATGVVVLDMVAVLDMSVGDNVGSGLSGGSQAINRRSLPPKGPRSPGPRAEMTLIAR